MVPLISCSQLAKAHGSRELFTSLTATVYAKARIGLIGPNGAGKSTLLQLMAKKESPDRGQVVYRSNLTVAYVEQNPTFCGKTVLECVANEDEGLKILKTLGFDDIKAPVAGLSGGWQRRLALASALSQEPDVLLLDEPTNHLDLESIEWLEGFFLRTQLTLVVCTHDRVFLENVCNGIWEVNPLYPEGILTANGQYVDFLQKKTDFLRTQANRAQALRSKLRHEEAWLAKTPKARTTKSRSRVEEAASLLREAQAISRREKERRVDLMMTDSSKQTKKLISAKNVSKSFGSKVLFSGIDLQVNRGDRIGIVGSNGTGKSTLLKILAKVQEGDTGTVKHADDLRLFFFDQHREILSLEQTLKEGLAPHGGETVIFQGSKVHVSSWAERFLFDRNRLPLPMKCLSGGERARVVIARLMLETPDVLLLDEPSNDLDIDTLELFEESLDSFPGAVILVTHDRALMQRVADQTIELSFPLETSEKSVAAAPQKTKKRTYRQEQELKAVEDRILCLEERLKGIALKMENGVNVAALSLEASSVQQELDHAFLTWEKLSS